MPKNVTEIYTKASTELKEMQEKDPLRRTFRLPVTDVVMRPMGWSSADDENKAIRKDLIHLFSRDGFVVTEKEDPGTYNLLLELEKNKYL